MRLFIACLFCAFTLPALAQPAPPPPPPDRAIITVQGEGKSMAAPDYAAISAEIVTIGVNLESATKVHRERATKGIAMLKAIDGLNVESSAFRLERVNHPPVAGQRQQPAEFRAVTSFQLKTKRIDAIDDIVTKIAATGLFEIHNLNFALDDNTRALDEARKNAVIDARHRAEIYAGAAGVKLGEVLEISDGERASPLRLKQAGYVRGMAVTPPSTLDVETSVTVTWRIRP
jgi:uncharacterized protein YggE